MSDHLIGYGEFVHNIVEVLEALGIPYLIGGAVAAWAWGEPRSTLDVDLVVDIPIEAIGALSKELEKQDMLVPPEIILNAILEDRADLPINAIHLYTGYKADIYPFRPQDELRRSALARRVRFDLGPPVGLVYLHSPEDLIIYKTWYFSLSSQTKHIRDITAILKSTKDSLDMKYIETWMDRKGLRSTWEELLRLCMDDSRK